MSATWRRRCSRRAPSSTARNRTWPSAMPSHRPSRPNGRSGANSSGQAFRAAPAAQPAEARTWDAERGELRRRVVQLEQALQTKEQRAGAERSQFAVDLNQMRQQLADETRKREEWQLLQEDRAQLQARVQ